MIQIGSKVEFIGPAALRLFDYKKPYTVKDIFPNPRNRNRILIRLEEVSMPLVELIPCSNKFVEMGVWIEHFREWQFGFEDAIKFVEKHTIGTTETVNVYKETGRCRIITIQEAIEELRTKHRLL